jgi:hypothetical protein
LREQKDFLIATGTGLLRPICSARAASQIAMGQTLSFSTKIEIQASPAIVRAVVSNHSAFDILLVIGMDAEK